MPVYNEQDSIGPVLTAWHHSLKHLNIEHDFVVINDGSTDNTHAILEDLAKDWSFLHTYNQANAGHGAAVKNGYSIACAMNNSFIFQTDSDHQFTPADFNSLWINRHDFQAIFGIRENRQDPALRKIISGLLQKVIFDIYNVEIPDANVPYRLIQKDYLKNLLAAVPTGTFAPNIFLSVLAFKSKLVRTKSLPVKHFDRPHGDQKLIRLGLLKGCIQSFFEIFKFSYTLQKKLSFIEDKITQDKYFEQQTLSGKHQESNLNVA